MQRVIFAILFLFDFLGSTAQRVEPLLYTCANESYEFLQQALGNWTVNTRDRTSPGVYENNKGTAKVTPSIEGCGISIQYKGTYNSKPYARSVGIVGKDSTRIQMVALDSEHGNYSVLNGKIEDRKMEMF